MIFVTLIKAWQITEKEYHVVSGALCVTEFLSITQCLE